MIYLKTYNEYFGAYSTNLRESDTKSQSDSFDLQEEEDLKDEGKEVEDEIEDAPENSPLVLGFLPRPWNSSFNSQKIVIEPTPVANN